MSLLSTLVPGFGGGGGASALADLTDVDFTIPPQDGDALVFSAGSWIAAIIDGGEGGYDNTSPNFQLSLINTSPNFEL